MALTPGALVEDDSGSPPLTGPLYPILQGTIQGPAASFITGVGQPNQDRLQLLAVTNTFYTVIETPLRIAGAGVTWVKVDEIFLRTDVALSIWRAMGAPVTGSLNIEYNTPQTDCTFSWCEVEDVLLGQDGANAVIRSVHGDPLFGTAHLVNLPVFAHPDNQTYAAFIHSKGDSSIPVPVAGVGFSIIHNSTAGIGFGYTDSLAVEYQPEPDQTVDITWSPVGDIMGIVLELGRKNVFILSVLVDSVIKAIRSVQVLMDGYVQLQLSILTTIDAAIKGPVSLTIQIDCVIEQPSGWLPVPEGVSITPWKEI